MNKIILLMLLVIIFLFITKKEVKLGPGIKVPFKPNQENIEIPKNFIFKDYNITALAKFHITAKVLSKHKYYFGREAILSPYDLALGWEKMSDEEILNKIDISQSGRWYRWWTNDFPIPRREIEISSANMHIIPSNKKVKDILKKVRKGHIVELRGYLVRVSAKDNWYWESSLTREDTGNHACELIFTEEIKIIKF